MCLKVLFFVDYNSDSSYKFSHSLAVSPPHTLPPDGQGFLFIHSFIHSSFYLIVITRRSSFLAQIINQFGEGERLVQYQNPIDPVRHLDSGPLGLQSPQF